MDTVLFLLHIRGLKPLLVFYFRVEEKFAGGKFRGRKISRNSIRSGYYFRGRKISCKIKSRENSENLLHAKNLCFTICQNMMLTYSMLLPRRAFIGSKPMHDITRRCHVMCVVMVGTIMTTSKVVHPIRERFLWPW